MPNAAACVVVNIIHIIHTQVAVYHCEEHSHVFVVYVEYVRHL